MDKTKFELEMTRAKTMQSVSGYPESDYWIGYQRGLRRNYHGNNFGTEQEHNAWLTGVDSEDESRKQRALGYRDGLKCKL